MKPTEETYLTRAEFIEQFVIAEECEVTRFERSGLPYEIINGVKVYPKNRCHRWFAGEE
jgi:hypothetical protein